MVLLTALSDPRQNVKMMLGCVFSFARGIITLPLRSRHSRIQDDCLVAKVEKLESAVKKGSDGR